MARLKIDYGIDLGTTNSAICRMDKGEVVIIKSDTLKDTMPSCVSYNKKKSNKVGDGAYNNMKSDKRRATKSWRMDQTNAYVEFKRKMGTDYQYESSYMERSYSAPELSAEVLKTLKSFVTDEQVGSVVITVPAMFKINQKDATMKAARLAGFTHCELLQEPIAAAMAYGLSTDQKNGYWLVFDFGGGTFDAALLKVEDGIMQVFDTEGDNFLGGKNLDLAIVDQIIIPYLKENYVVDEILADDEKKEILREAMKTYAEDAKNQLSFKQSEDIISNLGDLGEDDEGTEIELELTLTVDDFKRVASPLFQRAIDICTNKLLARNNMTGANLDKLILVGGPTHSPVLREMLREQITPNVDTSIDPMTAVASGAALYASTLDNKVKEKNEFGTVALSLDYEATTVEEIEYVNISIDSTMCEGEIPQNLKAEIVRSDKSWSSGKFSLTEQVDVIECYLVEGKSNSFEVVVYDEQGNVVKCSPNNFTIIQGAKVGSAILPYNIGIEVWDDVRDKAVFKSIKGLEKNKPLPATGVVNGLKTTGEIRPAMESDCIKIPLYQAEYDGDGLPAACFEYVYEVKLTGANLPALLPEGSDIDLTIKVDRSEQISLEVFIPSLSHSEDVLVPHDSVQTIQNQEYLQTEIYKASDQIRRLKRDGCDVTEQENSLNQVKSELDNGDELPQVMKHLKDTLQSIAKVDSQGEWERMEKRLHGAMNMLEVDNKKYGNSETTAQVDGVRRQMQVVISKKDLIAAKELLEIMHSLNFNIATIEYYMAWVVDWDKRFNSIAWDDRNEARSLIDQAKRIIVNNPSVNTLRPIVQELIEMLPAREKPSGPNGLLR